MESNNHHLHWKRGDFLAYGLSSQLRGNPRSQIQLPVGLHNELHSQIGPLDVPSAFVARQALQSIHNSPRQFKTLDTTRRLIDDMNTLGAQYHADAFAMAEHLSVQLPYLILGSEALKRSCV